MNVPAEQHSNSTSPAELTVPTIGQTVAWMVVMHKHGWEWVKMQANDSWRRPRGHGVIHSTTAGSWMIGVQPITEVIHWWHADVLRADKLKLSEIWFTMNYIWITFWECSPISISNILHAILYPIFLLYTLYLFYIQYSICCILLHISNIYAHVLFLYSTSYIYIPFPIFYI